MARRAAEQRWALSWASHHAQPGDTSSVPTPGRGAAPAQSTLPAVAPGSQIQLLEAHPELVLLSEPVKPVGTGRAQQLLLRPSCTNGLRVQSVLRTISKKDSSYFVFSVAEHLKMVMKSDQHLSTQMGKYVCEINLNNSDRFAFVSFSSTRKETDKLIQKKNHAQLINLV